MAGPDVMSTKRRSIILWMIIGIGLIGVLFLLTHQPNKEELNRTIATIKSTSSHAAKYKWNTINFNAPAANYNEITSRDIIVKGTNRYAIYSIQEDLLFDRYHSTLRTDAIKALRQITNSIEQRYTNDLIRIYEHTNDSDNEELNLQLTRQRVEAIRNWILQNSNISAEQLTIQPIGDKWSVEVLQNIEDPLKNCRVDIVAIHTY